MTSNWAIYTKQRKCRGECYPTSACQGTCVGRRQTSFHIWFLFIKLFYTVHFKYGLSWTDTVKVHLNFAALYLHEELGSPGVRRTHGQAGGAQDTGQPGCPSFCWRPARAPGCLSRVSERAYLRVSGSNGFGGSFPTVSQTLP